MRAYVLLNILNELRKSEKMRGWPSILSLFCNKFKNQLYRSTNIRFYLLHGIKDAQNRIVCEKVKTLSSFTQLYYGRH